MASQQYVNIISTTLLVTAVLGPILPGPVIAGSNLFMFRILAVILLPVLFVTIVQNDGRIQLSIEELLFWIFGVYLIALLLLSPSVPGALSSSAVVLLPIATGIIIAISITDRDILEYLLGVFVALLSVSLLIAMWEISTGQHLSTSGISSGQHFLTIGISELPNRFSHNMSAWYHNQNDFSAFVAVLSPLVLIKFLHGGRTQKLFSIVAFGAISIVMYQQFPRAALLGTIVAAVVCVLIFLFRQPLSLVKNEASTLLSITPFVGVMVVVGAVVLINDAFLLGNRSILIRWRLLHIAVDTARSTVIGAGLGSFHVVVQQSSMNTYGFLTPHNWLTWLLTVTGIPGTVLFLLLLGSLLRRHLGNYIDNSDPISLATIGMVVSFGIAGAGPSNIFHMEEMWILIGILAATTRSVSTLS